VCWLRSHIARDLVGFAGANASSKDGRVVIYTLPNGSGPWRLEDYPAYTVTSPAIPIAFGVVPAGPFVAVRYWFLVLVSGVAAIILGWRHPYQFSLRTLLIATTLVAVVLGMIAYATR
jgi:hypothetical protein